MRWKALLLNPARNLPRDRPAGQVINLNKIRKQKAKNEKEIRAAGKLRIEGKEYVMQDGDVCHFLCNR